MQNIGNNANQSQQGSQTILDTFQTLGSGFGTGLIEDMFQTPLQGVMNSINSIGAIEGLGGIGSIGSFTYQNRGLGSAGFSFATPTTQPLAATKLELGAVAASANNNNNFGQNGATTVITPSHATNSTQNGQTSQISQTLQTGINMNASAQNTSGPQTVSNVTTVSIMRQNVRNFGNLGNAGNNGVVDAKIKKCKNEKKVINGSSGSVGYHVKRERSHSLETDMTFDGSMESMATSSSGSRNVTIKQYNKYQPWQQFKQ